ncbi:DUF2938 family protein [Pokkaliibacter sp. CJK22405]|uniref:DUF2938 family protein n=1 Tax=Pokkaliibacter sp. CJK22405 TaxID=3384615 RepID=UPI0039850CA4
MQEVVLFCLIVGVISTLALDIWVILVEKVLGIPPTNWGMVGRWLTGLMKGQFLLDTRNDSTPSGSEKALGWIFHYGIGIAYAVLLLLIYGTGFISAPHWLGFIVVGVVLSTLAGLMILMPAMGGGLFARKTPNPGQVIIYILIAHGAFAVGQYLGALLTLSLLS